MKIIRRWAEYNEAHHGSAMLVGFVALEPPYIGLSAGFLDLKDI
jgi:hypothetical protein